MRRKCKGSDWDSLWKKALNCVLLFADYMGLTEDELAFYDLLSANEKLLNEAGPIQDLVHKVVASVKKNLQLDWSTKQDARAAIRVAVKRALKSKGESSELDNLLKDVLEQAEGQYRDWPMVG